MTDILNPIAQPAIAVATPKPGTLAAPLLPTDDHGADDTHRRGVVGGEALRPGHVSHDTHRMSAGSDPSASSDHSAHDTQTRIVAAGSPSTDSNDHRSTDTHTSRVVAVGDPSASSDHRCGDTQDANVAAGTLSTDAVGDPPIHPPATPGTTPKIGTPGGWMELRVWAEMFDDAQRSRIANKNRMERGGAHPDQFATHIARLESVEHECRLMMRRTFRKMAPQSIKDWEKASTGIGIDMLARLLGHLGHPVHATPHHWHDGPSPEGHACNPKICGKNRHLIDDEPYDRTVGQLWQFCGHGAPGRKWKGMTADDLAAQGKPTLKMLLHLMAENAMKEPGRSTLELLAGHQQPDDCLWPYRRVYEQSRLDTATKEHTVECVRCGPSGKPAQPGSPWSAGHQHAHGMRIMGKEILRDLWTVSA